MIGPILGAVAVTFSLSSVFAAAGVLLVGAAVVVFVAVPADRLLGPEAPAEGIGGEAKEVYSSFAHILRDRRLALLILGGSLLTITFTWWEADGLVLLNRVDFLGPTAYAVLFAVDAFAIILFQLPVSRWARRRDTSRLLFLGAALQGVALRDSPPPASATQPSLWRPSSPPSA